MLKWLYGRIKFQTVPIIFLTVFYALSASTSVIVALASKGIIDGAVSGNREKLIRYAVYMALIVVAQISLNLINRNLEERIKGKVEIAFKSNLLRQIMRKDYAKVTSYHSGEMQIRLFNDVKYITDGIVLIIPNVVSMITRLVCALSVMIALDKMFAVVFFVAGILMFLISKTFRGSLKHLHKKVQETDGKTRSFMQEAIESLLVIKAFSSEKKVSDKADELQEINYKAKMKRRTFGILANSAFSFVFQAGYVGALVWGGFKLYSDTISYGTLTAILQLVNQIQAPFTSLSGILPQYYGILASAERIMDVENLPDEERGTEDPYDGHVLYDKMTAIKFEDITFSYGRDTVLENSSMTINKGDFVAIMGISGIGKSTLLKLLLGVFSNYQGSIFVDTPGGKIPADRNTRKLFSYVPQGNMLLSGTIRENITFINETATEEEIRQAIEISCASAFISELPDGLETVIGEKGMGLSEGQIQRLAIARSILSGAPVLLLDEATSALDEETELRFLQNLKALNNVTCVIISHKRAALNICNKHVQILDKKIVTEEK